MTDIQFPATVYKVQTLTDMGIRVTLDLPEDCIPQMAMLAETKRQGIALLFTAKLDQIDGEVMENGRQRRTRKNKTG
jgi:hypothetical protein